MQPKETWDWPLEPDFFVSDEVLEHFRKSIQRGKEIEAEWRSQLDAYRDEYPELASEFERRIGGELPEDWEKGLPDFAADAKGMATRVSSGRCSMF
jgi:transketolase